MRLNLIDVRNTRFFNILIFSGDLNLGFDKRQRDTKTPRQEHEKADFIRNISPQLFRTLRPELSTAQCFHV